MDETVVRCPFCVLDNDFRPMLPTASGCYSCTGCGHLTVPSNQKFLCPCRRCTSLRARVASLLSRNCGARKSNLFLLPSCFPLGALMASHVGQSLQEVATKIFLCVRDMDRLYVSVFSANPACHAVGSNSRGSSDGGGRRLVR